MIEYQFIISLFLAITPAIITSLIEATGEWSNRRNYKQSKALDAIYSFRYNIGNQMDIPNEDCYRNVSELTNRKLQLMVIYLNQWSVYIINHIASKKIIKDAVGYELILCLYISLPVANELKLDRNLRGYFKLINMYHINNA